jgi:hypothetical protein
MMNWEVSGLKPSWLNRRIIALFAWVNLTENARETSVVVWKLMSP